ncbi:immune inhibitor A [Phycicoccus ginsengisoli]
MTSAVHSRRRRVYSLLAASSLVVGAFLVTGPASAVPPTDTAKEKVKGGSDNRRTPLAVKQDALRQKALEKRLKGDPAAQGKVVKVGKGQYVNLENEGTDKIFVVIAEFGDTQYPSPTFQGPPPDGSATDVTGPRHNEIPEPDRSVDNSTLWQPNYDRAHYEDMYFNRMKKYYETQSSGRYSVDGTVTEWVKVPFNEALYGRNYCGDIVCNTSKALVRDALAVWVKAQLDSGQTMAQIQAYLKTFDQQDRYDIDGDGNFNEPDGVIDHFQIVHAGGDEAAGDPNQGTDAIWSHRWGANLQLGGPLGVGVNIGSNSGIVSSSLVPNNPTGIWVYDYTMQPENGGLGVFAHEYGHDLGLPDLYDTSGNTGGAENNTAFWTLMSSGANIGDGGPDGIGDSPTDLGVWEKFQLGWLSPQGDSGPFYEVARAGEKSTHKLGPNSPATKSPQAVFVLLPDKKRIDDVGLPASGTQFFYSGSGNEFTHTMTRTTGITAGSFTAKVRYSTEEGYDYAFLEASTTGGTSWVPVLTNRSSTTDPNSNNPSKTGITGQSAGFASGAYVDLTATLPAGTNALRWRYTTDPAVAGYGLAVDDMAINGTSVGNAESDEGWVLDGFIRTTGKAESYHFNAYVLENRQYDGYDASLRTAYNFGFLGSRPDWVETYPYQDGLLVSYWDESFGDNNVGEHPGGGLILPVDAHPQFSHWPDGTLMRNRILSYDSTFGVEPTDAITLHANGVAGSIASKPAVNVFDDTRSWWSNCDEHACTGAHAGRYEPGWYGVDVPKTGTTVTVNGKASGGHLNITVAPK